MSSSDHDSECLSFWERVSSYYKSIGLSQNLYAKTSYFEQMKRSQFIYKFLWSLASLLMFLLAQGTTGGGHAHEIRKNRQRCLLFLRCPIIFLSDERNDCSLFCLLLVSYI